MKIGARAAQGFLRNPPVSCVLVYGPDRGLVGERLTILAKTALEDLGDPFRFIEISGPSLIKEPSLLSDESAAISFGGGRRVIMIGEATDATTAAFKDFLAHRKDASLVLVRGGELGPRSSLRKLFEKSETAATLACYEDDPGTLHGVVGDFLKSNHLTASRDVVDLIAENLGSDRQVTRRELEKLLLYMGGPGPVAPKDVRACLGDQAAVSLDAVIYASASGDADRLDRALERLFLEGQNPVSILRMAIRHWQRLHLANALINKGKSQDQAIRSLKPPVIFKFTQAFRGHLRLWPQDQAAKALGLLLEAEMHCKSSAMPPRSVCARALMSLCQAARRSAGRAA